MTKKEFAELLLTSKAGGDDVLPAKFVLNEVYLLIDIGIGQLLGDEYFNQYYKSNNKNPNGDWITTFIKLPVHKDEQRGDHYIKLPVQFISLTDNRGLQVVCKMKGERTPYWIIPPNSLGNVLNMEAGQYNGVQYCYPESNNVRLVNYPATELDCLHLVKMVAGTGGLEETRPIPMSAEMLASLFQLVQQLMDEQQKTPQKKINDGNPNTP